MRKPALCIESAKRLEEDLTRLSVEEVNLVSIDLQRDILADMRTGTWIDARYPARQQIGRYTVALPFSLSRAAGAGSAEPPR